VKFFSGRLLSPIDAAGEVVFNTSHSGYEEISTDPSYHWQIVVMTAPMQGNYGVSRSAWESRQMWISGFVCVDLQNFKREDSWSRQLTEAQIPILTEVDTRKLTLFLRDRGTTWGAIVAAKMPKRPLRRPKLKIKSKKQGDLDWSYATSRTKPELFAGEKKQGPRVAVLDLGCKQNMIRELQKNEVQK